MELNRIYNMDCLEGMRCLPVGHRYIVVTDPPFNVGYKYNTYSDRMDEDMYYQWLKGIIGGNDCVIVHYPESLYRLAITLQTPPVRVLSWVYNSNTPRQHRDIAFFGIKPDMARVTQPYKNPDDKRIRARIERGCEGGKAYDWIYSDQVKNVSKTGEITHPCQMPVDVMRLVVGVLPDDVVIVDPFMGSGTTAVACALEKKNFIGFELDSDYCDIANRRLRELTGPFKLYGDIGI